MDHERDKAEANAPAAHTKHGSTAENHHEMHAHGSHAEHSMGKESGHAGHVDHTGHEDMFRRRFWVSLFLSIPVLLYTLMLQMWFDIRMLDFAGSEWIAPVFAIAIFLYGGVPFI